MPSAASPAVSSPARPWDGLIPAAEIEVYRRAGFGGAGGMGRRPALLIIDVQYRSVGTKPQPIAESIQEYPTSCGEAGWAAVAHIRRLLETFRAHDWPIVYPHVAPKSQHDQGQFTAKATTILSIPQPGYAFVRDIAPRDQDLLLPKRHASAFFGTPLVSHLVALGVDTLVVTGCTTSGCVRGTVVDGCSYNYKVVVPQDAVFDRSAVSHAVNLFDMASKYADVMPTGDVIEALKRADSAADAPAEARAAVGA